MCGRWFLVLLYDTDTRHYQCSTEETECCYKDPTAACDVHFLSLQPACDSLQLPQHCVETIDGQLHNNEIMCLPSVC